MEKEENMDVRIVVPMTKTMDDLITDYWHERRLKSKALAIRQLIEIGLKHEGPKRRK